MKQRRKQKRNKTSRTSSDRVTIIICGDKGGLVQNEGDTPVDIPNMETLVNAIRFNHRIKRRVCKVEVNPAHELARYRVKHDLSKLTLPRRFNVVKTQTKKVKHRTDYNIDEPKNQTQTIDETYIESKPQHKVRSIF